MNLISFRDRIDKNWEEIYFLDTIRVVQETGGHEEWIFCFLSFIKHYLVIGRGLLFFNIVMDLLHRCPPFILYFPKAVLYKIRVLLSACSFTLAGASCSVESTLASIFFSSLGCTYFSLDVLACHRLIILLILYPTIKSVILTPALVASQTQPISTNHTQPSTTPQPQTPPEAFPSPPKHQL